MGIIKKNSDHELPTASETTLGGVKIDGTSITIDETGKISSNGSGTSDYTDLTNKPLINNVELSGNKTSEDLGILPTAPLNPDTKFLNGNKQWTDIAIGNGGYSANLYFTTDDSDVSGYYKISYSLPTSETILSSIINNQEILLRTYLFDNAIDITTIDAGLWVASLTAKVSSNTGVTYLKGEIFLRHADNSETTLFSQYSPELNNNAEYLVFKVESNQPSFTCLETDRLGVRVYGKTNSTSNITISTIVGDGRASYFTTPLRLRHNQLRDLNGDNNYLHITLSEKENFESKQDALGYIAESITNKETTALDTSTTKYPCNNVVKSAIDGKLSIYNIVSVADYGAVGDGVTDDTSAINSAISATGAYGKVVFTPGKTYSVSNPLVVTLNGIILDGQGATVKCTATTTAGIFVLAANYILLQNFTIDGNNCATVNGVSIRGIHNKVTNNIILNTGTQSILVDGNYSSEYAVLSFNYISGCLYNALGMNNSPHCQVIGNRIYNNVMEAICVDNGSHYNVVADNICVNNCTGGGAAGISIDGSNYTTVTGNFIQDTGSYKPLS